MLEAVALRFPLRAQKLAADCALPKSLTAPLENVRHARDPAA